MSKKPNFDEIRRKFIAQDDGTSVNVFGNRASEVYDEHIYPILEFISNINGIEEVNENCSVKFKYKDNVILEITFPNKKSDYGLKLPYFNLIQSSFDELDKTLVGIVSGMIKDNYAYHRESFSNSAIATLIQLSINLLNKKKLNG